jgi:hypothetical protein
MNPTEIIHLQALRVGGMGAALPGTDTSPDAGVLQTSAPSGRQAAGCAASRPLAGNPTTFTALVSADGHEALSTQVTVMCGTPDGWQDPGLTVIFPGCHKTHRRDQTQPGLAILRAPAPPNSDAGV